MGNNPSGESVYSPRSGPSLTPQERQALTAGVRGLKNADGQYHCFLNVCVQMLYHVEPFRNAFMACESHKHRSEPCIFCDLRRLFIEYCYGESEVLSAESLRVCLHRAYEVERKFQLESMADAEEAFEAILAWLHSDYICSGALQWLEYQQKLAHHSRALKDHPLSHPQLPRAPSFAAGTVNRSSGLCIAHRIFGIYTLDVRICDHVDEHYHALRQLAADSSALPSAPRTRSNKRSLSESLLKLGSNIGGVQAESIATSITYRVYVQELLDLWETARVESTERSRLTEIEADIRATTEAQHQRQRVMGTMITDSTPNVHDDVVARILGVDHTTRRSALASKEGMFALLIRDSYARQELVCPCVTTLAEKRNELQADPEIISTVRSGCSVEHKTARVMRFLLKSPQAFAISLVWPSADASKEQIQQFFALLPKVFDLGRALLVLSRESQEVISQDPNPSDPASLNRARVRFQCYSEEQAKAELAAIGLDQFATVDDDGIQVAIGDKVESKTPTSASFCEPKLDMLFPTRQPSTPSPFNPPHGIPPHLWPPKSSLSWLYARSSSFPLKLTGLICFYGAHYVAFVPSPKDPGLWLQLNDNAIGIVGTWDQLVDKCVKGRLQPTLLVFMPYEGGVPTTPLPVDVTTNVATPPSVPMQGSAPVHTPAITPSATQESSVPTSNADANSKNTDDSMATVSTLATNRRNVPIHDYHYITPEYYGDPDISLPYNVRTTRR